MTIFEAIPVGTRVAGAGFLAGALFGATAQITHFCTLGAISDALLMGNLNRLRAWLLAIAVALIGSQFLHLLGWIDLNGAAYLTPSLSWLGAIAGGFLFGFGMSRTGGCGNRTLVRLGAGNLKSLVVILVMGLFAAMTMRGPIAVIRLQLESRLDLDLTEAGFAQQGLTDLFAAITGLEASLVRLSLTLLIGGGLLIYCLGNADFRASPRNQAAGLILGLLIPAGWAITGILGNDPFDPVRLASFTFVGPTADGLLYLMTFTGATLDFGIAAIGGVILGAFAMALATRSFRLETFTDADDFIRHLTGAALMGIGGVLAMGCTIGQGMTGLSTLALSSLLTFAAILAGGVVGIRQLERALR